MYVFTATFQVEWGLLCVSYPGGGGYSLCDGWYICAAVLTPFFHFGRIEHDLFGVFFSSTNSRAIFWGTKTTNFYKNRSLWPQIQFFPRSFWVQFSAASGTPPSVFRPSTPPGCHRSRLQSSVTNSRIGGYSSGTNEVSRPCREVRNIELGMTYTGHGRTGRFQCNIFPGIPKHGDPVV